MKKIIIVLAIFAAAQVANAQSKAVNAAKAAVETAKADSQNDKKNTKVATWLALGKAYVSAYDAPSGNALPGSSKQELQLLMGNEKPSSTETVTLNGQQMVKEVYADKNLYFKDDVLQMVEVTKPVVANALDEALAAYKKAYAVDVKATKTKDISTAIQNIASKYADEAFNYYSLSDYKGASKLFMKAYEASLEKPYAQCDTNSLYNAGFTAMNGGDQATAKMAFEKCEQLGYYGEDGDVYVKLAKIAEDAGDAVEQKKILEQGFSKYPSSQGILIGLINYYVASGEDTGRLFELLDGAKKNEPTNASLYYVEGNIHLQLGNKDKAVESYEMCAQINPEYEYGYIGEGILFYNEAAAIQEKAQAELDDAKYMKLVEEFETALKSSITPFKKAFEITKDDSIKVSVAEFLKNACYRFRDESPEFQSDYDKYKAISDAGTAQ